MPELGGGRPDPSPPAPTAGERAVALIGIALAALVVVLGAYTRLIGIGLALLLGVDCRLAVQRLRDSVTAGPGGTLDQAM